MRTDCSWCGIPIELMVADVPRCKTCNKPLCSPILRDCWEQHWNARHAERPVVEVSGP